jgi:hypothetical protein
LSKKELKKEESKSLLLMRQEIRYMSDDEHKLKKLQEDKERYTGIIKDLKSGMKEAGRWGCLSKKYYKQRIKDIDIEIKKLHDKGIVLLEKEEKKGDEEKEEEE